MQAKARNILGMIGAAAAAASPAAGGLSDPPARLSITAATVSFPGGQIPDSVHAEAIGELTDDDQRATLTGSMGPITFNTWTQNAPIGVRFQLMGQVLGDVVPGTGICLSWDFSAFFESGKAFHTIERRVQVPNSAAYSASDNGLTPLSPLAVTGKEFIEFVEPNTGDGFFFIDLTVDWVNANNMDELIVEVAKLEAHLCIPSPAPTGLAGIGVIAAATRRRRRD